MSSLLADLYDRAERMYHVRGHHGLDPTEPPRGPFPYEAVPHSEAMEEIVRGLEVAIACALATTHDIRKEAGALN